MNASLLNYYEAIERASADMLSAARAGDWDLVVKLEGACGLLISQLKQAARGETLQPVDAQARTRIMQRILLRDAEIRHLAEPWLEQIDGLLGGKPRTLHDLYAYVGLRLTQANLHSDEAAVAECVSLVQPIHDAWRAIAPQVGEHNAH